MHKTLKGSSPIAKLSCTKSVCRHLEPRAPAVQGTSQSAPTPPAGSQHSCQPTVNSMYYPSMDVSSGKGVVRGRRGQQLEFALQLSEPGYKDGGCSATQIPRWLFSVRGAQGRTHMHQLWHAYCRQYAMWQQADGCRTVVVQCAWRVGSYTHASAVARIRHVAACRRVRQRPKEWLNNVEAEAEWMGPFTNVCKRWHTVQKSRSGWVLSRVLGCIYDRYHTQHHARPSTPRHALANQAEV